MKKISLCVLAISLGAALTACSVSTSESDLIIKEGEKVVTEALMKVNYNENIYLEAEDAYTAFEYKEDIEGYTIVSHYSSVNIYQKDSDSKYGVYSILGKKFIIDARLENAPVVTPNSEVGNDILYQDIDNKYYLIDSVGNIIYSSEHSFVLSGGASYRRSYLKGTNRKVLFGKYTVYDSSLDNGTHIFLKYDENYKASSISANEYYGMEVDIHKGDIVSKEGTVVNLKDKGVNRTVKLYSNNGLDIRVYEEDGSLAKEFTYIDGYKGYFVGTKYIVQRVSYEGYEKVHLSSYVIDFESLKESIFSDRAYFGNGSIIELNKPVGAEESYYVAAFQEVSKDGIFGAKRVMILDKDLKWHDDITYKNFVGWYHLSNNYFYDRGGNMLYDAEFNPVFSSYGLDFYLKNEIFIGRDQKGYYVVNNKGERCHDDSFYIGDTEYSYNSIYYASKVSDTGEYFLNIKDGSSFSLINKEEGKVEISEDTSQNKFITRITNTFTDDTLEDFVKSELTIRTFDNKELIKLEQEESVYYASISEVYHDSARVRVYLAEIELESKTIYYVMSNVTVDPSVIAAPQA